MGNILRMLGVAALRHYRDPLSWSGIIVAIGAACHFSVPPEYVAPIESILGSAVAILLLVADGRKNPNTTTEGTIAQRPTIPAGTSPVFVPTRLNGAGGVVMPVESLPAGSTLVSTKPASAGDAATTAGRRPGFGPTVE